MFVMLQGIPVLTDAVPDNFVKEKHSSLFCPVKKFYDIDTLVNVIKLFSFVTDDEAE